MNNTIKIVVGLIVGVIVGLLIPTGSTTSNLGGVYHSVREYFNEGISVGKTNEFTVSNAGEVVTSGDLTIGGGTLTVSTSNTATSTIAVGCIQSYATSTATSLRLQFTASTTAPTNGSGVIPVISYGTCPGL